MSNQRLMPSPGVLTRAVVLDVGDDVGFEDAVRDASARLAERARLEPGRLLQGFLEGSRTGATPVTHGVALPHLRLPEVDRPELVMVRSQSGLPVPVDTTGDARADDAETVHAVFFLLSPEEPPGRHLRTLAALASRIDDAPFLDEWRAAETEQDLKEVLIHNDRYLALDLRADGPTASLTGRALRDVWLPAQTLVALVHRDGAMTVPSGSTVLQVGDRVTILGDPDGIRELEKAYRSRTPSA